MNATRVRVSREAQRKKNLTHLQGFGMFLWFGLFKLLTSLEEGKGEERKGKCLRYFFQ